jgi:alpha-1,2-glucosyltransferase
MLGIALGGLYVVGIYALIGARPLSDENYHFSQIAQFLHHDWRAIPELTTVPGYHLVIAATMRIVHAHTLDAARLIHALCGLIAIAGFHALRRQVWSGTETIATAQFMALPILAPLFFLLYTDVPAIALLLWATLATLCGRHFLSALLMCLIIGVRQHEAVWALFLISLAVFDLPPQERRVRTIAITVLPYVLPLIGFAIFWWWNGSISLASSLERFHPDFSFHAGNVFVAILVAGLLMPLHTLAGFRDFSLLARRKPWLVAAPIAVFAAFWFGFSADNPYNLVMPDYYLHNGLVDAMSHGTWRVAAGIVVACAACGLATIPLRPRGAWAVYVIGAAFLAASWVVELRYVAVPFVIWLALREQKNTKIEVATLALWLVLAVLIFAKIVKYQLFL